MRSLVTLALCAVAAAGVTYAVVDRKSAIPADLEILRPSALPVAPAREPQPSAGLCPWRAPDKDRTRFFPGAAASRDETLILSRNRLELERRLGRRLDADNGALIVHRIVGPAGSPGLVVTRRVRGEYGLIELVLAADNRGRLLGARIQRHREPAAVAAALRSPAWLGSFCGKDSKSAWKVGQDFPPTPPEARVSANAIVNEARTVLIMLDVALHSDTSLSPEARIDSKGHG